MATKVRAHPRKGTRGVRTHFRLYKRKWVRVGDFDTVDEAERYADKHGVADWVIDTKGR